MTNEIVNLENFKNFKFLSGDLFWNKKSGKRLLIGQTGTLCNLDFVEKLITRGEEVELISFKNIEVVKSLEETFFKLKESRFEDERVEARRSLVPLYREILLNGTKESSLIDWSIATNNVFYDLDKKIESTFINKNSFLLERQILIASLMVSTGIVLGYLDFEFLKSLYNKTLASDLELAQKSMSSFHFQELEDLRLKRINKYSVLCSEIAEHGSLEDEGSFDLLLTQINTLHHGLERSDIRFVENELNELVILRSLLEKSISQISLVYEKNDAQKFVREILEKEEFIKKKRVVKLLNISEVR